MLIKSKEYKDDAENNKLIDVVNEILLVLKNNEIPFADWEQISKAVNGFYRHSPVTFVELNETIFVF